MGRRRRRRTTVVERWEVALTIARTADVSVEPGTHETNPGGAVSHEGMGIDRQVLLTMLLLTIQPGAILLKDGSDANHIFQVSPCIGELLNQVGRLVEAAGVHLNREEHVELIATCHRLNADDVQAILLLGEDSVAQGAPEAVHVKTHKILRGDVLKADGDGVLQHLLGQLLDVDCHVHGDLEPPIADRHIQDILPAVQPSEGNDLSVVVVDLEQTFLL